MARLPEVSDGAASWLQRRVFGVAKKKRGVVPEPLRLMAHSNGVMWAVGLFETSFERARSVDPTLKDLAQLKVASLVGCVF